MAEKPPVQAAAAGSDASPATRPKPAGNPAFRMMGLPNFRFKLPSRNWLIFLSITGSFTSAVLYDRYHKKRAQQRWCNLVSHIAEEPFQFTQKPRRVTIFLSAPPGDSLRAAREHFHEYVKPVLVAGALDWDVIEGRKEGDVRAGLAEKIRTRRRREGEKPERTVGAEGLEEPEDPVQELRNSGRAIEWKGVQGDLVLGRHTWKEYVRGLHEGWLGPLDPPPDALQTSAPAKGASSVPAKDASPAPIEQPSSADEVSPTSISRPTAEDSARTSDLGDAPVEEQKPEQKPEQKKEEKSKQPMQKPPYIPTSAYSSAPMPPSMPEALPPTAVLPLPHLLGFLNTPVRIYRFLNRRYLADETGREVAALVLASHVRAWDEYTPSGSEAHRMERLEQQRREGKPITATFEVLEGDSSQKAGLLEAVLEDEERDWHKSAWKRYHREPERVWRNLMVIDPRIRERMRRFDLTKEDEDRARKDEGIDPAADGLWERVKRTVGWEEDRGVKGWEHGVVGDEAGQGPRRP